MSEARIAAAGRTMWWAIAAQIVLFGIGLACFIGRAALPAAEGHLAFLAGFNAMSLYFAAGTVAGRAAALANAGADESEEVLDARAKLNQPLLPWYGWIAQAVMVDSFVANLSFFASAKVLDAVMGGLWMASFLAIAAATAVWSMQPHRHERAVVAKADRRRAGAANRAALDADPRAAPANAWLDRIDDLASIAPPGSVRVDAEALRGKIAVALRDPTARDLDRLLSDVRDLLAAVEARHLGEPPLLAVADLVHQVRAESEVKTAARLAARERQ